MGMGRVIDQKYWALPDIGARCRVDLQLVGLVLPCRQTGCTDGSNYQQPLLLAGVGRAVKHAGQTTLYLTAMHAAGQHLIALIPNIRQALAHIKAGAEQLPLLDRWHVLLNYIVAKITKRPPKIHDQLLAIGVG